MVGMTGMVDMAEPKTLATFMGQISLIGPNPEQAIFYNEFEKYIHGFSQRMLVRPGITGLAQVIGGHDYCLQKRCF